MSTGWVRETLHFDRPVSPLFSTTFVPAIERGYAAASARAGAGTMRMRVHDGYVYTSWSPQDVGEPAPVDRMLGEIADEWTRDRIPEIRRALDEIRAMARPGASGKRVAGEIERSQRILERLFEIHYDATFGTNAGVQMVESTLRRLGDPQPALSTAVLLAPTPSLLHDVEAWLAANAGADAATLQRSAFWPEVADRPAWLDLAAPTWGEEPERAARAAATASRSAFDDGTARALTLREEAEAAAVARFPPEVQPGFRAGIAMVRKARSAMQSINFLTGEVAMGALHGAYRRAGEILGLGGVTGSEGQEAVFLLEHAEVVDALRGGPLDRALLEKRREALARAADVTPPETIGDVDAALLADPRVRGMMGTATKDEGNGNGNGEGWASHSHRHSHRHRHRLVGLGASPGVAEGKALVALDEDDIMMISKGDVLVVRALPPAWTSAMHKASAVVAEMGGMLSHAAIVARELGIPAAVGVAGATTRLRTGEKVRVDGTTGDVTVL